MDVLLTVILRCCGIGTPLTRVRAPYKEHPLDLDAHIAYF
jgi:hypothetical protein